MIKIQINSQSLEDTQVGYISQNTLWKITLWKNTLWKRLTDQSAVTLVNHRRCGAEVETMHNCEQTR